MFYPDVCIDKTIWPMLLSFYIVKDLYPGTWYTASSRPPTFVTLCSISFPGLPLDSLQPTAFALVFPLGDLLLQLNCEEEQAQVLQGNEWRVSAAPGAWFGIDLVWCSSAQDPCILDGASWNTILARIATQ